VVARALLRRSAAVVCTWASLVWAEPKARPLAEELSGEARAAFDQGRTLFDHEDFATAHAKFRQAYDLSKSPRLLWNLAACSAKQRRYARAIGEAERYLDAGATALSPDAKDRTQAFLTEMKSYVAEATIRVTPLDASLTVDDEPRPLRAGTATAFLEVGKHTLRVEGAGFQTVSRVVDVGDLGKLTLRVDLVAERASPPWQASAPPPSVARDGERPLWPWIAGGSALAIGAGIGAYFLFKPSPEPAPYTPGSAGTFEVR
jgi:hypothetical protein